MSGRTKEKRGTIVKDERILRKRKLEGRKLEK